MLKKLLADLIRKAIEQFLANLSGDTPGGVALAPADPKVQAAIQKTVDECLTK